MFTSPEVPVPQIHSAYIRTRRIHNLKWIEKAQVGTDNDLGVAAQEITALLIANEYILALILQHVYECLIILMTRFDTDADTTKRRGNLFDQFRVLVQSAQDESAPAHEDVITGIELLEALCRVTKATGDEILMSPQEALEAIEYPFISGVAVAVPADYTYSHFDQSLNILATSSPAHEAS